MSKPRIAYLAPQITDLATTFVFKEVLGLEKRGYKILPFSVHKDVVTAKEVRTLSKRTRVVYDQSAVIFLLALMAELLTHPVITARSMVAVFSDSLATAGSERYLHKLFYQYLAGIWLARQLRQNKVKHLHIHFGDVPTQIGMYAAKQARIPFSFMVHANDLFQHARLYKQKGKRACAITTISKFNESLLKNYGVPDNKIHIVRCGINTEQFPYISDRQSHIPLEIGVVARLVEKKGVKTLLSATAILLSKGIDIKLSIAGDGPETESLKQQSIDLDISENVTFEGAIDNSKISQWFDSLDFFVLPAQKDQNGDMDGIPVVLMEAMALGIPVISTRISGIPELVINNKTGLVVTPDNAEELAAAITLLAKDKTLQKSLTENAYRHVTTEFNQILNLERLEAVIEKCIRKYKEDAYNV